MARETYIRPFWKSLLIFIAIFIIFEIAIYLMLVFISSIANEQGILLMREILKLFTLSVVPFISFVLMVTAFKFELYYKELKMGLVPYDPRTQTVALNLGKIYKKHPMWIENPVLTLTLVLCEDDRDIHYDRRMFTLMKDEFDNRYIMSLSLYRDFMYKYGMVANRTFTYRYINGFMAIVSAKIVDSSICPECGKPNSCAIANGSEASSCWCMTHDFPKDLKLIDGESCLCSNCVDEAKGEAKGEGNVIK